MAEGVRTGLTAAEGRRFGVTTGIAFLALGALLAWKGHAFASAASGALGLLWTLGGLLIPARLGPVHRAWMGFALALSRITTPLLLAIVYFGAVTPIGLIHGAWRRMRTRRSGAPASLWVARESAGLERRSDLRRQF